MDAQGYARRKLATQMEDLGRETKGSHEHARRVGRVESTLDLVCAGEPGLRLEREQAAMLKAHGIDVRSAE